MAEAARRAGVHPNTVRRLIHRGALGALMVKGRHGDTWLVDAVELRRIVGAPRLDPSPVPPPSPPPPPDAAPSPAAPDASPSPGAVLPVTVDLSLERAQALERYTRGLLAPLVDLLREREEALERREEVVREQAERIGRLEREVELLRARLARLDAAEGQADAQGPRRTRVTRGPRPPASPSRTRPSSSRRRWHGCGASCAPWRCTWSRGPPSPAPAHLRSRSRSSPPPAPPAPSLPEPSAPPAARASRAVYAVPAGAPGASD